MSLSLTRNHRWLRIVIGLSLFVFLGRAYGQVTVQEAGNILPDGSAFLLLEGESAFELNDDVDETTFLKDLSKQHISIIGMGSNKLRMVTHLDYSDAMHEKVLKLLPII